ncbi:MAG: DUF2157 domain-containing protein [Candidatus Omnitrophota bacterium]|nr:DUF2157 domain-containing protein [Candidatus Omnitrophota bacterium]
MENKPPENKPKLATYIALWLKTQLDFWCSRGILSQEQKENIKNLYLWPQELSSVPAKKSPLKLVSVIETIGALLIGIGVISLIAFNWPKIPNFTKLVVIAFAVIFIHLVGFFILTRKPNIQKAGFSLIFLANLLYGAGIWLVAQAYHIHANFATGIFLWALGIIPFAYIIKSRLNYFLAIALFILWTLTESISYQKPHLSFLFILLGLMLPLAYYLKSKVGLAICIITGAIWLLINNVFWFSQNFSVHLFLPLTLYGVLLIAASNVHILKAPYVVYQKLYLYTGIAVFSAVIFLLPFFGVFQKFYYVLPMANLSVSFWVCNAILLSGILVCILLFSKTQLEKTALVVKQMMPSLLSAALFIICMPTFKESLLFNLLPVLFIVFSYWYHTKSRILTNLALIYFFIWLPFCLITWKQPFMFFLLILIYGPFCYLLGWAYIVKFQDYLAGNLCKAFGLAIMFFSLYIFSFGSIGKYFARGYIFPRDYEFWYIVILLYLGIILLYTCYVSSFNYPASKKGLLAEERTLAPFLPTVSVIFFILISNRLTGFWYTFLVNLLFMCLLIVFLAAGYRRQQLYLKVITFIFLILLVGTRYIEMEWSLLYKAILFIITGIIVLVVGVAFEKNKDKVVIIED